MIFLLLHGKNRKSTLADIKYLHDKDKPVWRSYPKFLVENRWDEFKMMNEGLECWVYKDVKGSTEMTRISDAAFLALHEHVDFYLEETNATYIRVYGSNQAHYRLPQYASNRLILMEFYGHLLHLHEKVWCKKGDTTCKLPITIGEY